MADKCQGKEIKIVIIWGGKTPEFKIYFML